MTSLPLALTRVAHHGRSTWRSNLFISCQGTKEGKRDQLPTTLVQSLPSVTQILSPASMPEDSTIIQQGQTESQSPNTQATGARSRSKWQHIHHVSTALLCLTPPGLHSPLYSCPCQSYVPGEAAKARKREQEHCRQAPDRAVI